MSVCLNVRHSAERCHIHHLILWVQFKDSLSLFFSLCQWCHSTSCLGVVRWVKVESRLVYVSPPHPSSSSSYSPLSPLHYFLYILLPSHSYPVLQKSSDLFCFFIYLEICLIYVHHTCTVSVFSPGLLLSSRSGYSVTLLSRAITWSSSNHYTWQDLIYVN